MGVAISDASAMLARPLTVLRVAGLEGDAVEQVVAEVARLAADEDGLGAIVVGLPRRLDGSPTDMTPRVESFAAALANRTGLPVRFQDERLSSREAESWLALRERHWQARKQRIDAVAAMVILQDYLDEQGEP